MHLWTDVVGQSWAKEGRIFLWIFFLLFLIDNTSKEVSAEITGIPDPPDYPITQPQTLVRECHKLETHVLSRVTALTIPDGDRTVVQADNTVITFHPQFNRNGILCEKDSTARSLKLPLEKCSQGKLDESEDDIQVTTEEAYIDKMYYIGYAGMALLYRSKTSEQWKIRIRFPPEEVHSKRNLPISRDDYKKRLCTMFTSLSFNETILTRHGSFVLGVAYDQAADTLRFTFMTSVMERLYYAGTQLVTLSMAKTGITETQQGVSYGYEWIGAQEAFLSYKLNSNRTLPDTKVMFIRSANVLPIKVNKGGGLLDIAPNEMLTTLQLLGCPIHLCYRADIDSAMVDEYRVIEATSNTDYAYAMNSLKPKMYLFSGKHYLETDKAEFESDGTLKPLDVVAGNVVFKKDRTIDHLMASWSEVKSPVPCGMDGTLMVNGASKSDMLQHESVRSAWLIFKNNYVYMIYFKLNTKIVDQKATVGHKLRISVKDLSQVFGSHTPKFVDAAAAVGKAVFLFFEKTIHVYRLFMESMKAESAQDLVAFNAPGGYSGTLGFKNALYFFSYRRIFSYIVDDNLRVSSSNESRHPKELFIGCKNVWYLEEHQEGEYYAPLPMIQLSTVRPANADPAVWKKKDDPYIYIPSEEKQSMATTQVLTEWTEFSITQPSTQKLEESNFTFPILLGSIMGVLVVFLLLLIMMEMLRRKAKRRSGRGRSRTRSSVSSISKSAIPSSSSRLSSVAGSRSKVSSGPGSSTAGSRVSGSRMSKPR